MSKRHITKILDNTNFNELSVEQKRTIDAHLLDCADCRAAFQSARIASILLRMNSDAETCESTPFFQTKVLNAWREKQINPKPLAAFRRWWQASSVLVSMMIIIVIGLIMATLIGSPHRNALSQNMNADATLYSTETVILNENPTRNLTTEQVFEVLDNDD